MRKASFPLKLLFLLTLLFALLRAEKPFSFATTPGILPKDVIPRNYRVEIRPDFELRSFTGTARIEINATRDVEKIVLHALELNIHRIALLHDEQAPIALTHTYDDQTQTLHLPVDLPQGSHTLLFEYSGKIGTTAQGFFVDEYATPHGKKLMLGTQMEVADARRAFPCWDEPAFRATFDLSLIIPNAMTGVSNMPVVQETPFDAAHKRVTFARTPSMSTYLVAIYAAEFEVLEDEFAGVKLRILTTEGKRAGAHYSMEVVKASLAYQYEYFDSPYPLPKLDHIGVPNAFSGFGAMENWGAITYIDTDLLFDPAKASQAGKERVFKVIAHEVAHQWFGNLVTMAWWDNLWLNEGFASWLETKTTDAINPSWQVWMRANNDKETAMKLDAQSSTHPILQNIASESQAASSFDTISYLKSQSFLRMLENYLGEADFRDGIYLYINRHAYSNTTTADLWTALAEVSAKPVKAVAADWTERPGFPLVTATREKREGETSLVLRQNRFLLAGSSPLASPWKIPLTYARLSSIDEPLMILMENHELVLPWPEGSGPLKLNIDNIGFFRVHYDDGLAAELAADITRLPPADQLNLLSDSWALAQAERIPVTQTLDLLAGLGASEYPTVLELVLKILKSIDRYQAGQSGRVDYQRWALTILHPLMDRYGWHAKPGESPLDTGIRSDVIRLLGICGDPQTLAIAREKFQSYRRDASSLPGNLIRPVLSIVGRHADRNTYDQLHTIAREAIDTRTKRHAYGAMQASLDPALIRSTMALTLSDTMPTSESNRNLIRISYYSEQSSLVIRYAIKHYDELISRVGNFEVYRYLPGIANYSSDPADADLLLATIKDKLPADALPVAERAAENIRQKALFKQRILPQIDAWISNRLD